MEVSGAAAIVTGGASGIGAASARRLAKLGARCVLLDLNEQDGRPLAEELGGVFVKADVADASQVQSAVDAASQLGPLRVLVNAAGIGSPARTVDRAGHPADLATFERVIRINLVGSFNCIRLAAAAMAKTDPINPDGARGAIVNFASLAAFDGQVGQASYSASKGGVVGMTLPIARDLAVIGVRINTIAPGLVDTPIWGQGETAQQFQAQVGKSLLFPRRLGTADEIASMTLELITNELMNAETIRVDGGARLLAK